MWTKSCWVNSFSKEISNTLLISLCYEAGCIRIWNCLGMTIAIDPRISLTDLVRNVSVSKVTSPDKGTVLSVGHMPTLVAQTGTRVGWLSKGRCGFCYPNQSCWEAQSHKCPLSGFPFFKHVPYLLTWIIWFFLGSLQPRFSCHL